MAKPAATEMIILNFNHELRFQGFPFARLFGTPATGSAGFVAGEPWRRNQRFEFFGQLFLFGFIEARGVANMMQQPRFVI